MNAARTIDDARISHALPDVLGRERLLHTESASSSEVENLTAGARQVALAEIGAAQSENARLIVANTRAMDAAIALSTDLNEDAIVAIQVALLRDTAPGFVGGWRTEQVWIGGGAISPHDAEFIPPHHATAADSPAT